MKKTEYDLIIEQVAKLHNTTPDQVRKEIYAAMECGMNNPDPAVQSKWTKIPRKGSEVTLEEFLEYMVQRVLSQ